MTQSICIGFAQCARLLSNPPICQSATEWNGNPPTLDSGNLAKERAIRIVNIDEENEKCLRVARLLAKWRDAAREGGNGDGDGGIVIQLQAGRISPAQSRFWDTLQSSSLPWPGGKSAMIAFLQCAKKMQMQRKLSSPRGHAGEGREAGARWRCVTGLYKV